MSSDRAVSYSYAVFTFRVDDGGAITIPIGVALWSPESQWVKVRLVRERERLRQFNDRQYRPFVELVHQKIDQWLSPGKLPYSEQSLCAHTDDWWKHVRRLLVHRVRLSEPRPIDCRDPDEELEPLYESVVSSHLSPREQRKRVDGQIRECLDTLARKFLSRQELDGYKGRPVKVLRSYRGKKGWVVIEGVNLATRQADMETDATVSKLLRLREGLQEEAKIIIGYLASPQGVNGESVLVEWMSHQTKAKLFDLVRQRRDFRRTADDMLAEVDEQQRMF